MQMEADHKDGVFEELRARTEKAAEEAAVAMGHLVADREAAEKVYILYTHTHTHI